MEALGLLGMLGICGIEDFRLKKISIVVINVFAILGVILHIVYKRITWQEMLGGVLIGAILLLIAFCSKQKIGYGDGALFIATGIYLGFWNNLILLWISSILVAVFGVIKYFYNKRKGMKTKNITLPFAPFVLVVYIIMLFCNGGNIV